MELDKKKIFYIIMFSFIITLFSFLIFVQTINKIEKRELKNYSKTFKEKLLLTLKTNPSKKTLINFFKKEKNKIKIIRSKIINKDFKIKNENNLTENEKHFLKEGKFHFINKLNSISYYYPIKTDDKCLKCHISAKKNQTIALLNIKENNIFLLKDLLYYFLLTFFIIFIFTIILNIHFKKNIKNELKNIYLKLKNINSYKDLLNFSFIKNKYKNDKEIYQLITLYKDKLEEITFDRKLINFQIELLNKIVISEKNITNLELYLKNIFSELNILFNLNLLYSVLYFDNKYEILVIWKYIPSNNLKNTLENSILLKFPINENIKIIFNHQIIENLPFINEEFLLNNTQEIPLTTYVKKEKIINDFIGVGFNIEKNDKLKYQMLKNILSVLINLIKMVKVVNNYVNDINHLATRDSLTNLFNRRFFYEIMDTKLKENLINKKFFSLIFIDVDNFKLINDNYGHKNGDLFLIELSLIIKKNIRNEDIATRFGGDEFVIFINKNISKTVKVAERIKKDINNLISSNKNKFPKEVSLSIGIVEIPTHGKDIEELINLSDEMMYYGKTNGKNNIIICNNELLLHFYNKNILKEKILINAINHSFLIPYYQKIVHYKNKNNYFYETLMKIKIDNKILNAKDFIKIIKNNNLIYKMDMLLINKTLKYLKSIDYNHKILFNISVNTLNKHNFFIEINKLTKIYNFDKGNIILKITENNFFKDFKYLKSVIIKLKTEGFQLSISDLKEDILLFKYINEINIDYIKINGEFINSLNNKKNYIFLNNFISLCKDLKIKLIAEYIEDKKIYDLINKLEIDYLEGYYIEKPENKIQKD